MSIINRLNAVQKLGISAAAGIAVYLLLLHRIGNILLLLLVAWDFYCISFLLLNWITFFTTAPGQIRNEARKQDEGRVAVFAIALVATLASLAAVLLLLLRKGEGFRAVSLTLVTALGAMLLSWTLVHTMFAVRYAHNYYSDHKDDHSKHAGGLDFPQQEHPDFLDFAYFSFVIGMTFQVSDVSISSRKLRRMVLLHSLLAFGFNTILVALTINVIAGLSK